MTETIITAILFLTVYYIFVGLLLYIPLYYTRGIPDSLGTRKRYKEAIKTAISSVLKLLDLLT